MFVVILSLGSSLRAETFFSERVHTSCSPQPIWPRLGCYSSGVVDKSDPFTLPQGPDRACGGGMDL